MNKQKPSELEIALQTIEHLKNRIEVLEKGRAEDLQQILKVNEQLKKESVIALRESEEKFRTFAEQSPNMIFINKEGRIKYANEKCEEIMGYIREEFYASDFNFWSLIAPDSIEIIQEKLEQHARREEVEPYEYRLVKKDGTIIDAINMLILDSDFRKHGEGKIDYYCNYYVFGGFRFKATAW